MRCASTSRSACRNRSCNRGFDSAKRHATGPALPGLLRFRCIDVCVADRRARVAVGRGAASAGMRLWSPAGLVVAKGWQARHAVAFAWHEALCAWRSRHNCCRSRALHLLHMLAHMLCSAVGTTGIARLARIFFAGLGARRAVVVGAGCRDRPALQAIMLVVGAGKRVVIPAAWLHIRGRCSMGRSSSRRSGSAISPRSSAPCRDAARCARTGRSSSAAPAR